MSNLHVIRSAYHCADPRRESIDPSQRYTCQYCERAVDVASEFKNIDADYTDACLTLSCCALCIFDAATETHKAFKSAQGRAIWSVSAKEKARKLGETLLPLDSSINDIDILKYALSTAQVYTKQLLERLDELEGKK